MVGDFTFFHAKVVAGVAAVTLLLLSSLHFVFGLSLIVTLTIVLSFLIILVAAAGCALHLREIERFEEAEALDKMREKADLHVQFINEILSPGKARLVTCESEIVEHANRNLVGAKNLVTARRIIEALEERLELVTTLLQSSDPEPLIKAYEVSESKLKIKVDVIHAVDSEVVPDLESHLWRDTIDMLLIQVERQLRSKAEFAA